METLNKSDSPQNVSSFAAIAIYNQQKIVKFFHAPSDIHPYRALLNSDQVHRVYLDDLGDIRQLPLWLALMVLTTINR